jgi:DnaJ-class molecular chaperone
MLTEEYSEFICTECHGTGRVRKLNSRKRILMITCPKCYGLGKLDWIEHITGERYETKNKNR